MNYRGPYRIRLDRNKEEPEILHPRDAIVRVTRSCICGSDLHIYHGLVPEDIGDKSVAGWWREFMQSERRGKPYAKKESKATKYKAIEFKTGKTNQRDCLGAYQKNSGRYCNLPFISCGGL